MQRLTDNKQSLLLALGAAAIPPTLWALAVVRARYAPYVDEISGLRDVSVLGDTKSTFARSRPWNQMSLRDIGRIFRRKSRHHRVSVITSREHKMAELSLLLSGIELIQRPLTLPTLERVTAETLGHCAAFRALAAYDIVEGPVLIEEGGLFLKKKDYQAPTPGHYFKEIVEDQAGKKQFAKDNDGTPGWTQTALAYCPDGVHVYVYEAKISGKVVNPKNWIEGCGWDSFFVPEGFESRTLAELQIGGTKAYVNNRAVPAATLRAEFFREGHTYEGLYELHITVGNTTIEELSRTKKNPLNPSPEHFELFRQTCEELGCKPLYIRMDDPNKPDQLQTGQYRHFDNPKDAEKALNEHAVYFAKKGIPTVRIRAEALIGNREVPHTDAEAVAQDKSFYFDFHARVGFLSDEQREHMLKTLKKYDSGRARMAFWSQVKQKNRFFVNMRCYSGQRESTGTENTLRVWQQMLAEMESGGLKVEKVVKPEYCVLDNVPDLDYALGGDTAATY